ncbi:TPA: restriction endonuclease subunit S [Vibrio parahaemolyticus]|nr:restriction endonuclease subunit S [Vibrio parahaemolyticus]
MSKKQQLPANWAWSTIGDICKPPQYGWTTKAQDSGLVKLLRTTDITSGKIKWDQVPYCNEVPGELEKYLLRDGDIVVSRAGSVGVSHLVTNPEVSVFASYLIRFNPYINRQYVYYFLQSPAYWNEISDKSSGIAVQNVNASKLKNFDIPIAPLKVQEQIVQKIEELFSHIDAGVEGLKQAKAKLQQYRQSVLKDAVTGKLTEQWREQNADKLEPAEQLLERILDERRANWEADQLKALEEKGKTPKNDKWKEKYKVVDPLTERDVADLPLLPEGWCYAKLGQVIDDPKYGTSKKCTYDSKGKGVLRIPNIAAGEINPEDMKYAEFTDDEIATYKLNEGDILTIRSNGSVSLVGKCAVISDKDTDFLFAGYLIRLRPVLKHIDANYLKGVLTSGFLRKQIEMLAKSSSGVNNINTGELQSLIVPVCSLQEQRLIAQDIDSKNTTINRQFEEYERLFKQASKNKSAILKKAFSGELVENIETSESAEQLLGRIYEEKKLLEQKSRFAKKKPTARAKKMEKRPIIDVLKESNKALSVDDLFELAGFQKEVTPESIEEFYQELKTVAEAKFVEVSPILLGGKKQGDKFEYKEVKRK